MEESPFSPTTKIGSAKVNNYDTPADSTCSTRNCPRGVYHPNPVGAGAGLVNPAPILVIGGAFTGIDFNSLMKAEAWKWISFLFQPTVEVCRARRPEYARGRRVSRCEPPHPPPHPVLAPRQFEVISCDEEPDGLRYLDRTP